MKKTEEKKTAAKSTVKTAATKKSTPKSAAKPAAKTPAKTTKTAKTAAKPVAKKTAAAKKTVRKPRSITVENICKLVEKKIVKSKVSSAKFNVAVDIEVWGFEDGSNQKMYIEVKDG